jgi:Icc-related predicted phosphoesterase
MKLIIASDLHREHYLKFWTDKLFTAEADVLVLAGDIISFKNHSWPEMVGFLKEISAPFRHVLYILGNHEYYGLHPMQVPEKCREIEVAIPKMKVFNEPGIATIEGQRFICGTMWFPERKTNLRISDHTQIRGLIPWVWAQHRAFKALLENSSVDPSDVIVTHHTPSELSVSEQFVGDPYNQFFVVPAMHVKIEQMQPKLWIHGHTHTSFDYNIHGTRVVCNPAGYPQEGQIEHFKTDCVVEV